LFSGRFALICTAHFLAYACNLMVDPVLSLYLAGLGWSTSTIGLAFAAFSVTSFVTRPLIGRAVDAWSSRGTFLVGAVALAGPTLAYIAAIPALIFFGRLVHGLGWGCINTAGASLTTEAAPAHRRGEALGYYSMMPSLAATVAPAASYWIIGVAGFPTVFAIAASLAALAAVTVAWVSESPQHELSSRSR
jgi:MFS family permease